MQLRPTFVALSMLAFFVAGTAATWAQELARAEKGAHTAETSSEDAATTASVELLPAGSLLYWDAEFARLRDLDGRTAREERRFLLAHWRLDRTAEGLDRANHLKKLSSTYAFPPEPWIDAWRGLFMFRMGRLEAAAELIEKLHAEGETEFVPEAQLALGMILSASGQGRAAIPWIARAGVMKEFEEEALIRLIMEYRTLKEYRQEAYYRTLLRGRGYEVWPAILLERDNLDATVSNAATITERSPAIKPTKDFEYARLNLAWVELKPFKGPLPTYTRNLHWSRRLSIERKPGRAAIPAIKVKLAPSEAISVETEAGTTQMIAMGNRAAEGLVLLDSIGTPELRLDHAAAYRLMSRDLPTSGEPARLFLPNMVAQIDGPKGAVTLKAVEGRSEHIPLETLDGTPIIGIWGIPAFAPMSVTLEPGRPDGLLLEAEHLYYDVEKEEPVYTLNGFPLLLTEIQLPAFVLIDSFTTSPRMIEVALSGGENFNNGELELFDSEWPALKRSLSIDSMDGATSRIGMVNGAQVDLASLFEKAESITWDWDRRVIVMRPNRP